MAAPNVVSVLKAMTQHDKLGTQAFLDLHSCGRPPRAHYLSHEGHMYPLKALWAASHQPPIHTREFQTGSGSRGLRALGFKTFVQGELARQYEEGKRVLREVETLSRNPKLVADAKAHYGSVCKACGFDFSSKYGELGHGYIECHHIDPLSGRDGKGTPTKLEDVTVLCANCHRMIHRSTPALKLEELQAVIEDF